MSLFHNGFPFRNENSGHDEVLPFVITATIHPKQTMIIVQLDGEYLPLHHPWFSRGLFRQIYFRLALSASMASAAMPFLRR